MTGTPTKDQLDTAALLYAGPGSTLTGLAADAWWREACVVAEVDSKEWHLSPKD